MNWAKIITLLAVTALTAMAQQPEAPPQTPRQALLEMFLSKSPNALQKHLPENTLKIFGKLDAGYLDEFSGQFSMFRQAATSRGKLETFDAGPLLLTAEQNQGNHVERTEIAVDRDDLSGDEDDIELSLRVYRDGQLDHLPVVPSLIFSMKQEKDIWRLSQITLALRVPLSDPDYVNNIANDIRKQRQQMSELAAMASLRTIVGVETTRQQNSRPYACKLSDLLGDAVKNSSSEQMESLEKKLGDGKIGDYVFQVTNCSSSTYQVTAEPAKDGPGEKAFCADESGKIRFSQDGKGESCLSGGRPLEEMHMDRLEAASTAQAVD